MNKDITPVSSTSAPPDVLARRAEGLGLSRDPMDYVPLAVFVVCLALLVAWLVLRRRRAPAPSDTPETRP